MRSLVHNPLDECRFLQKRDGSKMQTSLRLKLNLFLPHQELRHFRCLKTPKPCKTLKQKSKTCCDDFEKCASNKVKKAFNFHPNREDEARNMEKLPIQDNERRQRQLDAVNGDSHDDINFFRSSGKLDPIFDSSSQKVNITCHDKSNFCNDTLRKELQSIDSELEHMRIVQQSLRKKTESLERKRITTLAETHARMNIRKGLTGRDVMNDISNARQHTNFLVPLYYQLNAIIESIEKSIFDLELIGQDKKTDACTLGYLSETWDMELPQQISQNKRDPTLISEEEVKNLWEQIKSFQDVAEIKRQKIIKIKRQIEFSKDEIKKLQESSL